MDSLIQNIKYAMGKNIEMKDAEGLVICDEPIVTDSGPKIYALIYNSDLDDTLILKNQNILDCLQKELKRKLGKCKHPRKIDLGDVKGTVLQFDDFVKENYPSQVAKDYDNSQTCYDNRFDDEEEEE